MANMPLSQPSIMNPLPTNYHGPTWYPGRQNLAAAVLADKQHRALSDVGSSHGATIGSPTGSTAGSIIPSPPRKKKKNRNKKAITQREMEVASRLRVKKGTAFPRNSAEFKKALDMVVPEVEIRTGNQTQATHVAQLRLEALRLAFEGMENQSGKSSAYDMAQQELHNAEVDHNYCLYYPQKYDFRPVPANRNTKPAGQNSGNESRKWRAQLWRLVEQSMQSKTLTELQSGDLVERSIPGDVLNVIPVRQSKPAQDLPKTETIAPDPSANQNVSAIVENRESPSAVQRTMNTCTGTMPDIRQVSPGESILSAHPEDAISPQMPAQVGLRESLDTDTLDCSESSSNGQVMINTGDWKAPDPTSIIDLDISGETMTEGGHPTAIVPNPKSSPSGRSTSAPRISERQRDEGEITEDEDAMMQYSDANGRGSNATASNRTGTVDVRESRKRILADLNAEALNKQVRYFHVGRTAQDVDLQSAVRCLACSEAGHDAYDCTTLDCQACGMKNHMTPLCPQKARCTKCREAGHRFDSCPYKLKKLIMSEVVCDLCQRPGHFESECEMVWRTSGKPWEFDFSTIDNKILNCYECGKSRHLGNDCTSRRPGKKLGSSTWSVYQHFDVHTEFTEGFGRSNQHRPTMAEVSSVVRAKQSPKDELHIRGTAGSRGPIPKAAISGYGDDDDLDFLHARPLPEPTRKGKIQVNAVRSSRFNEPPSDRQNVSNRPTLNQPFGAYGVDRPRYEDYNSRFPGRENEARGDVPRARHYDRGRMEHDSFPNRDRYRSRSPEGRRGPRYETAQKPGGSNRGVRGGTYAQNVYRPMPSAGQNAWRQHRL